MKLGTLTFTTAIEAPSLLASSVFERASSLDIERDIFAAEIDSELADTAAFCEAYNIGLDISANCVIVKAKRANNTWFAAVVIMATDRADINKVVKKHLDARKISFAAKDEAVELTQMEFGGITPIGLPKEWPILIDTKVAASEQLIIGSGLRKSKVAVSGKILSNLPNAEVIDMAQK